MTVRGMIRSIKAAQRLDSKGLPTTIQVEVTIDKGDIFCSSVPSSGAFPTSTTSIRGSSHDETTTPISPPNSSPYHSFNGEEAADIINRNRNNNDDDDDNNISNNDITVRNVEDIIAPSLIGKAYRVDTDLKKIDALMRNLDDGLRFRNKGRLGANATLGVSMACARAGAAVAGVPLYEFLRRESGSKKPFVLPVPFFNVLNGGLHSPNSLPFENFMVAPVGAKSMTEAIRMCSEVYYKLQSVISSKYGATAIRTSDKNGLTPPISRPHEALDLLTIAIAECGYTGNIQLGIDLASNEFFHNDNYDLSFFRTHHLNSQFGDDHRDIYTPKQLRGFYISLLEKYPVVLLEDPFAKDDWSSWTEFNKACNLVELVGDDLLIPDTASRVQEAYEKKACDAMLLKLDQVGTVSEAITAANKASSFDWSVFISHNSEDEQNSTSTDDFLADLAVGLRTGHLKAGSPSYLPRHNHHNTTNNNNKLNDDEKTSKYNRLMDIEAELIAKNEEYEFAGIYFRKVRNK